MKLPTDLTVRAAFTMASRRHPLVMGAPNETVTVVSLEVPEGFTVSRAPADAEVKSPCLSFSRKVKVEGGKVSAELKGAFTCERISPGEYAAYRGRADEISRLLDEELVMSAVKSAKPAPKAAQR